MQKSITFLLIILVAFAAVVSTACETLTSGEGKPTGPGAAGVAASVNGKQIKLEEVERIINQQLKGQQQKLSPLELAQARLQALSSLVEREVMYQRAEKDKMVPSDDEITKAINDKKTQSGMTSDDWEKQLKESGETEQSVREIAKKELAIKKLVDNITSKVEPPKDSEVEAFFKGNPDAFIDKRGAKFAAIIIDPQNNGEGDTTKNETEAQLRIKEIGQKLGQGVDFATLAREYSEDPQSRMQGGDWRALSEEEMKQAFGPQIADAVMNKMQVGQMFPVQVEGRYLLLKLQQKKEQNENLTLESPGVKQQITDVLVNARKQLISQAFIEQVMNEAKIENYLAKQIVDNPNAMSGARPADAQTAASPAATPAESPAASPAAANTNASTAASPAQNANAAKNANAPKQ